MATKVDVPFTDEKVDPSDPGGALKSIAILIAGFTILLFSFAFGSHFAGSVQDMVADALGLETDDGNSQTLEVV